MCEFCQDDKYLLDTEYQLGDGGTPFQVRVFDNNLRIEHFVGDVNLFLKNIRINYCPMCGRRLGKE